MATAEWVQGEVREPAGFEGGIVHRQSIPTLKVFVTNVAAIAKDSPEVDRLYMIPDQTTSRGFEVFAYWADESAWNLLTPAHKLVKLLWVLEVLIIWN